MVEVDLSMDLIATNGQMWLNLAKTRGTLKMKILKKSDGFGMA